MSDPMLSFADAVRARRSVRAFDAAPLPDAVIAAALVEAQCAPSNCNTQPWATHIVSGKTRNALSAALHAAFEAEAWSPDFTWDEKAFTGRYAERRREQGKLYYEALGIAPGDLAARRRSVAENFSFFGAPHAALLFMPAAGDCVRVAGDLGMYGQTFLLSLAARGLGGVPQTALGLFAGTVRAVLGVSEEMKLLYGISFGTPAADARPNRMGRDAVSASVTFHK